MLDKTVEEIASLLGKNIDSRKVVKGFAVDSRKVGPGFLFFALKGEKVDGHSFLEEIRDKGAVCAVIDKNYEGEVEGLDLIFVEDVLYSLKFLAGKKALDQKIRCIGITGSVGKTTTKEFLSTLLEGSFKLGKTPGNENSQVGVPLSILHEKEDVELFIAEMGMSRKGEIASLVAMMPPEIALVTQVALAHALYFPGGVEEVAEAKAEILSKFTKKAFLHAQTKPFSAFHKSSLPLTFYGKDTDSKVIQTEDGYRIQIGKELSSPFTLPFTATHLIDNFLGAVLVARELGVSFEEILSRVSNLKPYKMRFERVEKDDVIYINDSYNASPASMKAALENIPKPLVGGKVIAALGHMGELGSFSKRSHEEVGRIAALHADVLLCVGDDTDHMAESFAKSGKVALRYGSFEEFKKALKELISPKDVVLIKASNSLRLWRVLEE